LRLLVIPSFASIVSRFFFLLSLRPPYFTSFPSRRSSDLFANMPRGHEFAVRASQRSVIDGEFHLNGGGIDRLEFAVNDGPLAGRSEEHTSELQSHLNLVSRLLL